MRLPDTVLKSVVFLGRRESIPGGGRKFKPEGTGFLVSSPSEQTHGFEMTYLVTAKHVSDKLEPDFDVRFNRKDGRADYVEVSGVSWFTHPTDKSVDAAVLPWAPPSVADCRWIPHDHVFLDEKRRDSKGIGVGDEVYATGLFAPTLGRERNCPIVRSGSLAASPPIEVPIRDWPTNTMTAYLIEMRSLGGLSGSPVFVQRSIEVQPTEHTGRQPLAAGAIFLLGLMHGHWNVQHLDLDYVSPPGNDTKEDLLNAGIAIVTPADKITEIIRQPALADKVAAIEAAALAEHPHFIDGDSPPGISGSSAGPLRAAISSLLRSGTTTKDSLSESDEENPRHKEDFTALLNAAAKTKQQDDQT